MWLPIRGIKRRRAWPAVLVCLTLLVGVPQGMAAHQVELTASAATGTILGEGSDIYETSPLGALGAALRYNGYLALHLRSQLHLIRLADPEVIDRSGGRGRAATLAVEINPLGDDLLFELPLGPAAGFGRYTIFASLDDVSTRAERNGWLLGGQIGIFVKIFGWFRLGVEGSYLRFFLNEECIGFADNITTCSKAGDRENEGLLWIGIGIRSRVM